jgi:glycosyltransferase involved in cell wall biosynthesis
MTKTNNCISVIIPNYNAALTIEKCLESAFASDYDNFEVIVVDDGSTDNSIEIIKQFPCKLIRMGEHSGTSKARNTGAKNSRGEILFFIDADCLLQKDTLTIVDRSFDKNTIMGGTYTKIPYDDNFFSTFQSIFINYSETKNRKPDYIAAHAMVMDSNDFIKSGGFPEKFLPIIEDVEFSHRLRRAGFKLIMNPEILVQHIFNFTLVKSLRNAFRKSKYWTIYSLTNKDLLADSGTASIELKTNVASFFLCILLLFLFLLTDSPILLMVVLLSQTFNVYTNRKLIKEFLNTKGLLFTFTSISYYMMVYPLSVGAGSIAGIVDYLLKYKNKGIC